MAVRVQVILDEKDFASIRDRARRDGLSVSAWMRAAARALLERASPARFRTEADVQEFFEQRADREDGVEPDWTEHLATMARSRDSRR